MAGTGPGQRAPGIRLATIGGVPVYLGPSWLILAAVIVTLIGPQVAASRPDLGTGRAYAVGLAYAVVLLLAVLVHEAAHAVSARAFGFPVHRVVADLWGGHTALDVTKARPGASALVAVAGPAANAALWLLGTTLVDSMEGGVPRFLVNGVGYVNGMLALFNLLPGLPLDGGQIVEALVWRVTGSRARGRTVAGYAGIAVAVGVLWWFIGRPLRAGEELSLGYSGWGLLIAFFLWQGARQAIGWGRATTAIESVRILDVLTPVVAVRSDAMVADLPTGLPPVVVDASGTPVALVDPAAVAAVPGEAVRHTPVSAIAVPQPAAWVVDEDPNGSLAGLLLAFGAAGVGVLALVHRGRLLGVVTASRVQEALGRR